MSNLPNCTLSETMQYTLECMGNIPNMATEMSINLATHTC
jgi:hypothetical protein